MLSSSFWKDRLTVSWHTLDKWGSPFTWWESPQPLCCCGELIGSIYDVQSNYTSSNAPLELSRQWIVKLLTAANNLLASDWLSGGPSLPPYYPITPFFYSMLDLSLISWHQVMIFNFSNALVFFFVLCVFPCNKLRLCVWGCGETPDSVVYCPWKINAKNEWLMKRIST